MQRMIDFSGASKVQESLRASLMARYDERNKTMMDDMELDMVSAARARAKKPGRHSSSK